MRTLLAISAVAALALAGALPASAQTFEWGGGFTGQTGGTSSAWNLGTTGSFAQGGGVTNGGAGTVGIGGAVIIPPVFGGAAAGTLFSSGASGASSALATSATGPFAGATGGSATGSAMGSASGFLSYHP